MPRDCRRSLPPVGAIPTFVMPGLDPGIHTVMLLRTVNSHGAGMMVGFVYMMASRKGGTIYTGATNDLPRRVDEHRSGNGSVFTGKYAVQRLVWYEEHFDIRDAIQREKTIKGWPRQWKVELIERENPEWYDLMRGIGW